MKKRLILFLITGLLFNSSFAQPFSNFVFFSEDGEPFNLVLNGVIQNNHPQTNVKVEGLNATNYKVKVIFEDKTIPAIEKNVFTKPEIEITYAIKKNNKGENVLRYYSEAPVIHEVLVIQENQDIHPPDVTDPVIIQDNTNSSDVSINLNINNSGIGINSTDGSLNISAEINLNANDVQYSDLHTEYETTHITTNNNTGGYYQMPGYSGRIGCPWPMEHPDFQKALNTIENADFDSDKLIIAKQIVSSNCLTAQQIKELTGLFDFENDKLDFAKFAYKYTYDVENYYIINDVFEFSSSIKELDDYIRAY
jgi:hypothetical protein